MIQIAHLAVAAAISSKLEQRGAGPLVGLGIGLTSHLLLDSVPHIEPTAFGLNIEEFLSPGWWWAVGDFITAWGLVGMFLLWRRIKLNLLLMAVIAGAYGPDVILMAPGVSEIAGPYVTWFNQLHEATHTPWRDWYYSFPTLEKLLIGAPLTACTICYCTARVIERRHLPHPTSAAQPAVVE
jgi:hypothetical protein